MADIPGFLTSLTLDSNDVTLFLNDLSLARARNVMSKPTMDGTGVPLTLAGQETTEMSMAGQVDTAGNSLIEATWAKRVPVSFTLVVGDGATLDAGTYSGEVNPSQYDSETSASDSWNFTLAGVTGVVAFTPPT